MKTAFSSKIGTSDWTRRPGLSWTQWKLPKFWAILLFWIGFLTSSVECRFTGSGGRFTLSVEFLDFRIFWIVFSVSMLFFFGHYMLKFHCFADENVIEEKYENI